MKVKKLKEYKGFTVGEMVLHKSKTNFPSYGEVCIKEFDLHHGYEDVIVAESSYDNEAGKIEYTTCICVSLDELSKIK